MLIGASDVTKDFKGPAYRLEHTAAGDYYWEWIGNQDAYCFGGYALTCATLFDSTPGHPAVHYFQVLAHAADPSEFWASAADSGYSVDNLAPGAPQGVAGQYDYPPGRLSLHWHRNPETDLSVYYVYRGEGPGFVPSKDNRIAMSSDTLVTGLACFPIYPWYIKVSAVDIHGNESPFTVLPPEYVTIPTLVSSFRATWASRGVEVTWVMVNESAGFGFHVSRRVSVESPYTDLSCEVVGAGRNYSFRDPTAEPGKTYWYRVLIVDEGQPVASFETSITTPPLALALHQNYPNPFNPGTTIDFALDEDGPVSLRVYDVSGRLVRTLVDGSRPAAAYAEQWDGRDDHGNEVASGVYVYRLTSASKSLTKKMVLLR
jgi:hypothetical protein